MNVEQAAAKEALDHEIARSLQDRAILATEALNHVTSGDKLTLGGLAAIGAGAAIDLLTGNNSVGNFVGMGIYLPGAAVSAWGLMDGVVREHRASELRYRARRAESKRIV